MPCRSDWPESYPSGVSQSEYDTLKSEHDQVVRLLCTLISRVPHKYVKQDSELVGWWSKHQQDDIASKAKEREQRRIEKKRLATERANVAAKLKKLDEDLDALDAVDKPSPF